MKRAILLMALSLLTVTVASPGAGAQTPGAGRVLGCTPETQSHTRSDVVYTPSITCTVTDASGAPTPGVDVTFATSGPGTIASTGTTPEPENDAPDGQEYRTDSNGQVVIRVGYGGNGVQTVTATISGQAEGQPSTTTECTRTADDPAGAPAGACQDQVTVEWSAKSQHAAATNLTIRYRPRLRVWEGEVGNPRAKCQRDRLVRLKRFEPGPNPVIAEDISNESGVWRITRGNRAGRYYAVTPRSSYVNFQGVTIECLRDRSITVKIG